MRLIDADAEIAKIEADIKRYEERIKEWHGNRNDRNLYNVDLKIKELEHNITECKIEIRYFQLLKTFDMQKYDKEIRNQVIDEFSEELINKCGEVSYTTSVNDIQNVDILTLDKIIEVIKEVAGQMKERRE